MKKRKTFAVVSSVVLSIYLTILLPNQVTFADENIEERSEKERCNYPNFILAMC